MNNHLSLKEKKVKFVVKRNRQLHDEGLCRTYTNLNEAAVGSSVTRLGDFLTFFGINFLQKQP